MRALGIDPGFTKLGWASMSLDDKVYTFHDMGCIKTSPVHKKQRHNIRKTDDEE